MISTHESSQYIASVSSMNVEGLCTAHQTQSDMHSMKSVIIIYILIIREYGSTVYVGMPWGKNGTRIERVH